MLALLASYNEPLYQSLFDVSVAQVGDLRSEKKNLSTYWNSFIPWRKRYLCIVYWDTGPNAKRITVVAKYLRTFVRFHLVRESAR